MIKLGDKVRDKLTGFSGIATGRADYLFHPSEFRVEPPMLTDGKPIDPIWIAEARLEADAGPASLREA